MSASTLVVNEQISPIGFVRDSCKIYRRLFSGVFNLLWKKGSFTPRGELKSLRQFRESPWKTFCRTRDRERCQRVKKSIESTSKLVTFQHVEDVDCKFSINHLSRVFSSTVSLFKGKPHTIVPSPY